MAFFINAFLEVDETNNEETIRLLKEKGNYFKDRNKAIKAQKLIIQTMKTYGDS